jgi:protein involved in polysaccharide export with SLBB domain
MIIDNRSRIFTNTMYIKIAFVLFIAFFVCFDINHAKGQAPSKRDSLINEYNNSKVGVEPTTISPATRKAQGSDYQVVQKAPSSGVFGSAFFNTESLSFEPNLRIATPANYILGPDDELAISVSGYQEMNIKTPVQPEGTILIPQVGSINVLGLSIEAAISRIKTKMGQTAYPSLKNNSSKLSITLSKIRSIRITIIGAVKPGNFTVSSLTTVFNSLSQSGGPGDINTYREIELIRNNKVYETIDIYQFLTRGDQKGNILLKDGDVINFPVYKKHVTVKGEVKRPGIFELKDGETFQDLLFFAGGYTDKAYKATVKIAQVTDIERKIKDIPKAELLTYLPSNGDDFQVDAILDRVENAVSISGAVNRPGQFELVPGLTLSRLINKAGGLQEDVFTDRATLTRKHADGTLDNFTFNVAEVMNGHGDMVLMKYDAVAIASSSEFKNTYAVIINGEVKKAGSYPFKENLSLKDVVFEADGFTDAASSYHLEVSRRITDERRDKNTDSVAKVFDIDIEKELSIEQSKFILQPYDIITVRKNPGYLEQQRVTIAGEVNFPGIYTIQSKTERISDLLKRAGGLTSLAYSKGMYLIRNTATDNKVQQQESIKKIQGSIKDTTSRIFDDVVKTNFRIPINIKKVLEEPTSIDNYTLLDGDSILILKVDPLVKLSGEVLLVTKTGYIKGKHLGYYLTQAGGTTERARKSKIYVLYADGHIKRVNNGFLGLFRSYPAVETGAEIIVPRKIDKIALSPTEVIGLTSGILSTLTLIVLTITSLRK